MVQCLAHRRSTRRAGMLRFIRKKQLAEQRRDRGSHGRYASRTRIANSRPRVNGRFVKTADKKFTANA